MPIDSYQLLLNYAFRLLARKAYAKRALTLRLERRAEKEGLLEKERQPAILKVLERLMELGYVNDEKILEDYFEYRLKSRPEGKFSFLQRMHRRGISFEQARKMWDSRGIDEEALAQELLEKKAEQFSKMPSVLQRQKMVRLLASRGFSPETVWKVVEKTN